MGDVLVFFGGNTVAYNAAAVLAGSGHRVWAFLPGNVSKTYAGSRWFEAVGCSKHSWQSEGYISDLLEFLHVHQSNGGFLTLLTNDAAVATWMQHGEKLSCFCFLPYPDIGALQNKSTHASTFAQLGLDTPRTWRLADYEARTFPYLIKLSTKTMESVFAKKIGAKVLVVRSDCELAALDGMDQSDLLAQEMIDFNPGDEWSWWGYRDPRGEIESVTVRHVESYPDQRGRLSHARLETNSQVRELGDKLVQGLDYHGLADIQFLFDKPSESYKVVDFNPRLRCGHELLAMSGRNLLLSCVNDYLGGSDSGSRKSANKDTPPQQAKDWYSVLYNIGHITKPVKNTEHYALGLDNWKTRTKSRFYLWAKFMYYLVRRTV